MGRGFNWRDDTRAVGASPIHGRQEGVGAQEGLDAYCAAAIDLTMNVLDDFVHLCTGLDLCTRYAPQMKASYA
jgi:hypothetical protein